MSEELDILKIVADNPNISQRKISEQTGISLGQVNFLIKKCVKKGLIKIEGQTSKSIKYNLTPKGITEKAKLTMQYIKISYGAVIALTDKIRALEEQYRVLGKKVYIFGSQDEMLEICKLALGDKVDYINSASELTLLKENDICFYWEDIASLDLDETDAERLNKDIIWINILT